MHQRISSFCSCHRRLTAQVNGTGTSTDTIAVVLCMPCLHSISACSTGFEFSCWLATMAVRGPADMADVADGFATRLEVTSRGMARTLKMQHGTTKVPWVTIIVALQQCHNDGLEPDKLQEALKERAPAFYDRVADWQRIRQVLDRVPPQCTTAL